MEYAKFDLHATPTSVSADINLPCIEVKEVFNHPGHYQARIIYGDGSPGIWYESISKNKAYQVAKAEYEYYMAEKKWLSTPGEFLPID